jgi:hypothetical protein
VFKVVVVVVVKLNTSELHFDFPEKDSNCMVRGSESNIQGSGERETFLFYFIFLWSFTEFGLCELVGFAKSELRGEEIGIHRICMLCVTTGAACT